MQRAATSAAETATLSTDGFGYGDLALQVAARPAALTWLAEFLSPAFRTGGRGPGAATIALHEDTPRYQDMLARRPPAGPVELDCFVNDSHTIRLPSWAAAPSTTVAFQENARVLYGVDRASRTVTVLSPEDNPLARTALMRSVRELAMNHAPRHGGTFLHAAAIAVEGRGMLIAGEKRAGKTTLLLHLLRETGADFVSNDRVLVPSPDAEKLRGMPTIVTVRGGTFAFLDGLSAVVERRSYHYRRTLAEAAEERRPIRPSSDGSHSLSAAQLCALLGVARRAECTPHVLVFPRVSGATGGARLRDLSAAEAAVRLRRALLSADLAKRTSDLMVLPDDPPPADDAAREATAHALAARIPCVECELGPHAYASGGLAAACRSLLAG